MTDKKETGVINGVAFYAAVHKPKTKYKKDGSKDPLDLIYAVDLVVDAKVHREMGKRFPKQKKEPLTVEEFTKRYSIDPPEGYSLNADGDVCMLSFKTNYAYRDRKTNKVMLSPKPKVFFKNEDGKLIEDVETLVGNGSTVGVQWESYYSIEYKTSSYKLKAIRVDEHIPYEFDDYSELGEVDQSSLKDSGFTEAKAVIEDLHDEDPPFDTDDSDDLYD